jgi:hypothetical protein
MLLLLASAGVVSSGMLPQTLGGWNYRPGEEEDEMLLLFYYYMGV